MAVNRNCEILGWAIGSRGAKTGKELWEQVKDLDYELYATDYWEPYMKLIPKEKHLQTKAETFTVEGVNNLLRHYIARFHRKTHCYSKALNMIHATLTLFINKDKLLSILS